MIPSRWSSAIAILRRRLAAADAERQKATGGQPSDRQISDRRISDSQFSNSQISDRQRAHLFLRGRDQRTIEHDLLGYGEIGGEESIPVEPRDPLP